ncbi:primase C-terminal domain-containing protein [Criibacterium bergeronii]|uniref:DNA primase n=1 Tax=Criibacterium bergeronii TaxID=1871336 RepID=A0A1C0AE21_9FIRM|nr:primase C-terminal domain-containing protein [Criibacterium bergeronii]RDY21416.1 DNA primase [Criibacterium bergeronii]
MNVNINYGNIPDELKQLNQWVCTLEGSKVPMKSWENEAASSTNPHTWSCFTDALSSVEKLYYDYLGFVFNDNGIVGIDIDAGYDDEGLMNGLSADIIGKCGSYTEKSRSGRGFHILLRGTLPFNGKNNLNGVEIYKTARYFIMTGHTLLFDNIVENQEAIDYIVEKYFPNTRDNSDKVNVGRDKIYSPVWEKPVVEGKIKLRPVYPRIPNGSRNICLTSLAGMLHNQGYSKAHIYDELLYANTVACDPPLDKNELRTICNSVTRYKR